MIDSSDTKVGGFPGEALKGDDTSYSRPETPPTPPTMIDSSDTKVGGFSGEALKGDDISSGEKVTVENPEDLDDLQDLYYPLTLDTFSLMYIAPYNSLSFLLSVMVFIFRTLVTSFVYIDIIDPTSDTNPLSIPIRVNPEVTSAQVSF